LFTIMIRNITFMEPESGAQTADDAPEETILRLRLVTVSPAEEYQLRGGEVRPISNELASAILSYKGRAKVENKGVVVDRKDIGGRFVYFHEDSIVINDFSVREKKLYYVINRLVPEVLHLLDDTGAYIESLPLRERPAVLDNEAQAEQVRQNKTIINRAASRLQELHAPDTREKLEEMAANSKEMQRVIQVLPAACSDPANPVQPHRATADGEIVAEVTRQTSVRVSREKSAGSPSDIVRRRTRTAECPF
jgi:hypothetical protein